MAYSPTDRERARELYCVEGLTYDQVAERTGISVRTLYQWGGQEGWRTRKQALAEDLAEISANTIRLRKTLISKVLKGLDGDADVDPQKIYAVSALEGATAKLAQQAVVEDRSTGDRVISSPEEAIAALEEAVQRQVNHLLQPGGASLAGIREVKQALDLIAEMKRQHSVEDGKAQVGLSPDLESKILDVLTGKK